MTPWTLRKKTALETFDKALNEHIRTLSLARTTFDALMRAEKGLYDANIDIATEYSRRNIRPSNLTGVTQR